MDKGKFMIKSELTEFVNEPFDDYVANDHFANVSTLKKYKKSPLHKLLEVDKITEAKEIGRMYHCFVLEPKQFEKTYVEIDDRNIIEEILAEGYKNPRNTNKYKDWYFEKTGGLDRVPIMQYELELLRGMKKELLRHNFARYLIERSSLEISAYGMVDGILSKGRYDMLLLQKRWIADLKAVRDSSYFGFQQYLKDFSGQLQVGLYTQLAENYVPDGMPWRFFWIAQEKIYPYAVGIYQASAQITAVGIHEIGILLQEHKFCLDNDQYDGYEVFVDNEFGIREIDLPNYVIKDYQFFNKKNPIKRKINN